MKVVVFGVTHKNSTIAIREKVAFSKSKLQKAYNIMESDAFVKEAVILSTCNRSEIIAVVEDTKKAETWFKDFYINFFHLQEEEIEDYCLFKKEREAVKYLYEVCCGLDSLVLGEDQILGQVKEAHQMAIELKHSGKILNKLFLEAITTAKEIKTKTSISENPLSISYIAVKQVEKQLNSLKGKSVLVVGFGEMSRLAVEHLLDKGIGKIYICNRRSETVEALIKKHDHIQYIDFDKKYSVLKDIDILISATGAPHYVYYAKEFEACYQNNKPLCIVDIALPRDIDPAIGEIQGIKLFHIDQLKDIANENLASRQKLIEEIQNYIEVAIRDYEDWYQCLPVYPKIEAIKNYSQQLADEELNKMFKKLSHIPQKDRETIEIIVRSLVKKMWRKPILQLKDAGVRGKGEEMASFVDEFLGL
ncbi:glutamyl-tRNA reductase [Clostridium formicaceticum]|uniref:Glutamyl-tRNA reductase n=1 Tax=Clostridium formicaceticum TaxID=1497 RepID=A0AAC9RGT2_9CLOT|nr:glutamyl-tRNA reductase [Clostridium formicaceticum]AOY75451.1 glutamyl-tRNA reductase [Clostridium formicaceticum]ARE85736.1 Glutamyl-tRNA reductase [Clostridium formicaceticum]